LCFWNAGDILHPILVGGKSMKPAVLVACLAFVSCTSAGTADDAGNPALSIAWDAGEGVRYLLGEGCIVAVDRNMPVKDAIDRGQAMSRVRVLERSPLNDPAGTPAYALISSASVVITGTAERCRIAASTGEPAKLRDAALRAIASDSGWRTVISPAGETAAAGYSIDARCKPAQGGAVLLTILTASAATTPVKLQAIVSRSGASCPA
jgi:hypothetical protein